MICLDKYELEALQKLIIQTKPMNLLDIGCGDNELAKWCNETQGIAGYGIDKADCDLSYDKLPFNKEEFDCVTAIEVLEHLDNVRHCFKEVKRVINQHGAFIFSVPSIRPFRRTCINLDNDHYNDLSYNLIEKFCIEEFHGYPMKINHKVVLPLLRIPIPYIKYLSNRDIYVVYNGWKKK